MATPRLGSALIALLAALSTARLLSAQALPASSVGYEVAGLRSVRSWPSNYRPVRMEPDRLESIVGLGARPRRRNGRSVVPYAIVGGALGGVVAAVYYDRAGIYEACLLDFSRSTCRVAQVGFVAAGAGASALVGGAVGHLAARLRHRT